jgi:hypothetical protein
MVMLRTWKEIVMAKAWVIMTVIAALVMAGPASADPATVLKETIVIPLEGEQLSHPCTGELLGIFTSGTVVLQDHVVINPNGTAGAFHRKGMWSDLRAVGFDGSEYRVIAEGMDVSVFRQESGLNVNTSSSRWMMFGPEGLFWRGQVVFHLTISPDGHVLEFVHASPDAQCQ